MKIILSGEPIAKIRPRICRNYSYDPQEKLKNAAKWQILDQIKDVKKEFPISDCAVSITFYFYTSPRVGEENLCEWGLTENIFKKDLDNFCKFSLDVMNGIVYDDDRQVNKLTAWKKCSTNPRTEIIIMKEKQSISDKTKQVLCAFRPTLFVKMANDMKKLADQMLSNTECAFTDEDFLDTALMICEFSENYASEVTKVNKKFKGFAKVLREEKNKLEGL